MCLCKDALRTHQSRVDALEALLDKHPHGLVGLLEDLVEVAAEKSHHLVANWQDRYGGKYWLRAGELINKVAFRVSKL